jgi:DnaJ-class molecular chaperone
MQKSIEKQAKLTCPDCNGNGFTRIPYHLAKEEIWASCEECNTKGYIPENKWDTYGKRSIR